MKVPPHSTETERGLLGSVLLDPSTFDATKALVRREDFYVPANAIIWSAFDALRSRGQPIDGITLHEELARIGKFAEVGGDEYVLSLTSTLPWSENAEPYARTVRDLAKHRALLRVCAELQAIGFGEIVYEDFRAQAERAIREVTTAEVEGEPKHIKDVLADTIRGIEAAKKRNGVTGLTTGIRSLDEYIGGWQAGRLYVIAGRPGMGKSALTLPTIIATKPGVPILEFSIEMPDTEQGQRLLCADSGLDLEDITKANLGRDHWHDIMRSTSKLSDLTVFIDDATRTLDQIVAKARRFHAKHGKVGAIIVDYLQLVRGNAKVPREQQVSEVSRELKALAKELGCAAIVLSQLNRQCEERPDKRPMLSDLRESGAIEQDADCVILIYRKGYYAAQMLADGKSRKRGKWEPESDIAAGIDDGIAELIVAKQRGGRTGTAKALFQGQHTRFVDLAHDYGGSDEQRF